MFLFSAWREESHPGELRFPPGGSAALALNSRSPGLTRGAPGPPGRWGRWCRWRHNCRAFLRRWCMFMDTREDEKTKLISCLGAFGQFWAGLSQESHEQCIRWILEFVHGQHSPKRIFLYDCLAMAVETGLLPPRVFEIS
ncbi:mediator of RNA polymerase II transcription subunit 23-like [Trichechus manatus latirostris]|uniref:Mediator of RNA polymerase II transcription subunit 23-like n=1 Tax=Trichechus manatus latirostris TaxID=127582 RepID=A0A2Y9QII4_TRIMA|nr:mediator of RNA polymerase II transcription subunit 23-like [Trichechus manatus latirostris]